MFRECMRENRENPGGGHWYVRWAQKEVPLRSSNQRGWVWCPGIQGAKRAYWMSQIWKVSVDLSIEVMTPGKSSLRKHGKGPRLRVWEFTAVIEKELIEGEFQNAAKRENDDCDFGRDGSWWQPELWWRNVLRHIFSLVSLYFQRIFWFSCSFIFSGEKEAVEPYWLPCSLPSQDTVGPGWP